MADSQPFLAFEFVADEALRVALTRDAKELALAATNGANKSSVVLAGSIIEAVLLDHLLSTDFQARTGTDPAKLEFWRLIESCHTEGAISDRSKHLLHAVRDYRNLIHPGRSYRLKQSVDAGAAAIATGIVQSICSEMSERPNKRFGMKAEQVIAKVKHDPKILSMLDHLLDELRPTELDRLIVDAIPAAIVQDQIEAQGHGTTRSLTQLYRQAFKRCSLQARKERTARLAQSIQSESEAHVKALLTHTFSGWHLQYATAPERSLIVARLEIESRTSAPPSWSTYEYILNVIGVAEAFNFVETLLLLAKHWPEDHRHSIANNLINDPQYGNFPVQDPNAAAATFKSVVDKLTKSRDGYEVKGNAFAVKFLNEILEGADFPF